MFCKTNTKLPELLYLYIFRKSVAYASCDIHQKEDFWQHQNHVKSYCILSFFKGSGWLVGTATWGAYEGHLRSSKLCSASLRTSPLTNHPMLAGAVTTTPEKSLSWRFPGCFPWTHCTGCLDPRETSSSVPSETPRSPWMLPCIRSHVNKSTPFCLSKGQHKLALNKPVQSFALFSHVSDQQRGSKKGQQAALGPWAVGHGCVESPVSKQNIPAYQLRVHCANCPTHTTAGQTYYLRNDLYEWVNIQNMQKILFKVNPNMQIHTLYNTLEKQTNKKPLNQFQNWQFQT